VDGPPLGNYSCADQAARLEALERCGSWAKIFREAADLEGLGPKARLLSSEFSASTHHRAAHACTDKATLRDSYRVQTREAERARVELFFWSWKMPHGGRFRPAWSFKHLLYTLGLPGARPDLDLASCGAPPALGEPTDDFVSSE